jgi:hypothetical protein
MVDKIQKTVFIDYSHAILNQRGFSVYSDEPTQYANPLPVHMFFSFLNIKNAVFPAHYTELK